jgi:hypothetical protein
MIDLTTAGGLRGAVASEWTKLWSLRSTWWFLVSGAALLGLSALTLGGGTATSLLNDGVRGVTLPAGESVISAVTFAQFAFVTVAMLAVTETTGSSQRLGTRVQLIYSQRHGGRAHPGGPHLSSVVCDQACEGNRNR